MSDTATATGDGTEPTVADVADAFVVAVCHPEDVEAARATVARVDPVDLGGLVAAVDDHQPMTLEVAVDVLAELGVSPATIAIAVGVDHEDVQVLLGAPLGGPPPALADRDARIIEVVASHGTALLPDGGTDPTSSGRRDAVTQEATDPDVTEVDARDTPGADDLVAPTVAAAGATFPEDVDVDADEAVAASGPADAAQDDDRTVAVQDVAVAPVRIESGSIESGSPDSGSRESGGDAEDAPTTVSASPPNRGRILWAVVLFVLLIGGMIALAALLGAF